MRTVSLVAMVAAVELIAVGARAKGPEVVKSGSWSMTLPLGLQADAAYIPDYLLHSLFSTIESRTALSSRSLTKW
jgi:hypothetical protein